MGWTIDQKLAFWKEYADLHEYWETFAPDCIICNKKRPGENYPNWGRYACSDCDDPSLVGDIYFEYVINLLESKRFLCAKCNSPFCQEPNGDNVDYLCPSCQ
jgi:hypothetical protein